MPLQGDDDFVPESSVAARLKEHGIDLSSDPYLMHRHGVVERSSCYCRSLSPKRVEKEGTVVSLDNKGRYGWLDRDERLQGLVWPVDKRPDYHEMISSKDEMKTYELCDNVVGTDAKSISLRYGYENIGKGAARHSSKDEMKTYELCDNVVGTDAKSVGLRYEYENIGKGAARHSSKDKMKTYELCDNVVKTDVKSIGLRYEYENIGIVVARHSSKDEMKTYELCDNVVGTDAKSIGLRYGYDNIGRGAARHDCVETERLSRATEHEIFRHKSMALQEESGRGVLTQGLDSELKSKYVEGERSFPSDPKLLDLDRLEVRGAHYPDPHLLDKLTAMEMYGRGERLDFHSKNIAYPVEYTSQPKDLMCTCHIKGNATRISRGDYPSSFKDDMAMQKDIHPLTSAKFGNQFFLNEQREEFIFRAGRREDVRSYYHDRCSASRTNDQEYVYPKTCPEEDYNHGYLSEGLNRRRNFHQLNVSPSRVLGAAKERIDISQRNLIGCSSLDHHSSQTALEYLPSSTSPAILRQDDFYRDSRETYAEKQNFREREMPCLCISQVGEVSRGILNPGSDNDAASNIYFEKWRKSSGGESQMEILGHGVGTEKMESCVHCTKNELARSLKRKYSLDNEMIMHNSNGIMPRKLTTMKGTSDVSGVQDQKNQDAAPLLEHDIEQCRKVCKVYEKEKSNPVTASHNLLSSHNPMEQGQKLLINQNEPWKKQKIHQEPSSLSWHNMSQHNTKYSLPKNVWVRGNIDKQMEVHENKVKESKSTLVDSAKSVLPEGPNKFDQQVQKFFLIFTKKVNEDLPTRKRYKEKGRAGGLICLACGKRQFRDAQSLGAHCFMTQKHDLKAKHLGLLKAICVLMGWNTVVGPNVTTFLPEPISRSNASAQREDLILWPPTVIVHNCTKSSYGPQEQQVKTLRKIEDLLRGEGFSLSKIKVCLGKPSNGSVVVIKFLATFPGLKDAEKLHEYFIKKGHGRKDLNQASDKGADKLNEIVLYGYMGAGLKDAEKLREYFIKKGHGRKDFNQASDKGADELKELVLYGYMGIAEDLDEVDKDTSSRCLIKSKKEIHDFEDAPVYTSKHQLS
nr:suppressor of gene silencing like protein [Ipomoea batatas]